MFLSREIIYATSIRFGICGVNRWLVQFTSKQQFNRMKNRYRHHSSVLTSMVAGLFCCVIASLLAQPARVEFKSIEALPENGVAFRIHTPAAGKVTLQSDIYQDMPASERRPIKFEKDGRGVWEGICLNVAPGAYR